MRNFELSKLWQQKSSDCWISILIVTAIPTHMSGEAVSGFLGGGQTEIASSVFDLLAMTVWLWYRWFPKLSLAEQINVMYRYIYCPFLTGRPKENRHFSPYIFHIVASGWLLFNYARTYHNELNYQPTLTIRRTHAFKAYHDFNTYPFSRHHWF